MCYLVSNPRYDQTRRSPGTTQPVRRLARGRLGFGLAALAPPKDRGLPGARPYVRDLATSRSIRAGAKCPPRRPRGEATLVVCYNRQGEGRGRSQNCNNKTPQKGPRPYSSSTTEALARDRTRGSVGLSSRPSGLFFPVDLREERHRAETDTATTALRRFDVASTAPAGTLRSLLMISAPLTNPPLLSSSPLFAFSVS